MILFPLLFILPLVARSEDPHQKPYTLEIENRILKRVISDDSPVEILDLSSKQIKSIQREAFQNLETLKTLNLRNNSLETLPEFIFSNLNNLEFLSLAENNISQNDLKNLFVGLDNLQTLNLSSNPELLLKNGFLFGLPKSVNIYVHGNNFLRISPLVFEKINISGEIVFDPIRKMTESNFIRTETVKLCSKGEIVLAIEIMKNDEQLDENCNAIEIDSLFLSDGELDLIGMKIKDFDKGWYRLQNKSISLINLSHNKIQVISKNLLNQLPSNIDTLKLDHNLIKMLTAEAINTSYIKQLTLRNNVINYIEDRTFKDTEITLLNLNKNHLENLEFVKNLPSTLLKLDLGSNQIQSIPEDIFSHLSNLQYLGLEENSITSLESNGFRGLMSLTELIMFHNGLSYVAPDSFSHLKTLKNLLLGYNDISTLPNGVFENLDLLKSLNLRGNKFLKITSDDFLQLPNYLDFLDLSDNKIESVEAETFIKVPRIDLSLSGNRISQILPGSLKLPELKYLHLENNFLIDIKSEYFEGLPKLEKLYLEGNKITNIENGFCRNLTSLTFLDISENPFLRLENGAFYGLSKLATVDITDNRIELIQGGLFDEFKP